MKKYRFALIGCGKIAPRHAEQIVKYGTLSAVCDIVRERADALALQYDSRAYYSIDELLEMETGVDVVSICTPNGFHAEHAIKSSQAGKHVLCEKPMCLSVSAGWSMRDTAYFFRRKLFVVKSARYNPYLQSLKEIISEGKMGELYSFQLNCFWNRPDAYYADHWRGTLFPDGGTLYTQFSHYIDALLWLFGEINQVRGFRKNMAHRSVIEFEDTGIAALEMESGILGGLNWSVNSWQKNMEISLTILAENGCIRLGGEYMNRLDYFLADQIPGPGAEPINPSNDYGNYQGSMSNHDKVYENLLIALDNDKHPFVSAEEGIKTVAAIEKIYQCVSLSE